METRAPDFISRQVAESRLFFLDLRPRRGRALRIVCGGCERCAPSYELRRQGFRFLALEFVAAGAGRLELAGRTLPLNPGLVFTYGPRVPHRIIADRGNPPLKFFVDFVGAEGEQLLASGPLAPGAAVQVRHPEEIRWLFERLLNHGMRRSARTQAVCSALARALILCAAEAALPPGTAAQRAFSTYERVREVLEREGRESRGLQALAREAGVEKSYLCRLFRRFSGESPHAFLTRRRMARAAERLRAGGALVKEVAEEAGFGDPYHFSRVFKRVYGLSPEAFRQYR